MAQKETPRQDPDPDIMFIFPIERPYGCNGYIWTSDRLDALRGTPCGERVSRLDKRSEIAWQTLHDARKTLHDARKLDQERFKNFLEKSDKFDEKLDRVSDKIDAKFDLLRKALIIGFISLGGIGVAGAAIIVALIIFLFGGE